MTNESTTDEARDAVGGSSLQRIVRQLRYEAQIHQTVYEDDRRRKVLFAEAADEMERLLAQLEVSNAATAAAISKANWQAVTNRELNELMEDNRKLREMLHESYEA